MMRRWIGLSLFGIWLATGVAAAQTTGSSPSQPAPAQSPSTTPSTGAFNQLSPGNQKIAQSLFAAQKPPSGTAPLTLDQIAAMKQSGKGWGEVFKEMKAQGLVPDKNLGQAVSAYSRQQKAAASPSSSKAVSPSTSGRTPGVSSKGKSDGAGSQGDTGRGSGSGGAATGGSGHGAAFGRGGADVGGNPGHSGGQGGGRSK